MAVALVRHPALEARLAETPDDPDAWSIYEDWLMEVDDPRAQIVKHERLGETALAKSARAELDHVLLGDSRLAKLINTATWRAGHVRSCYVQCDADTLRELFATPAMRFVTALQIAARDVRVFDRLADVPLLRKLRLTSDQLELDVACLAPLRRLTELELVGFGRIVPRADALPQLRALSLHMHRDIDLDVLVKIGFPNLARLSLQSHGIHPPLEKLGPSLPNLRSLVIGITEYNELEQMMSHVIFGGLAATLDHLRVVGFLPRSLTPGELASYRNGALARISHVELPASMF